jgi:hypothetical protein
MLDSANTLDGRKATSFFATKDDMVHAGALWLDESVVVDGNLITGRKPDDLPDFMKVRKSESRRLQDMPNFLPSHLLSFFFSKYLCLLMFIRGFFYPLFSFLFPVQRIRF